MSCLIYWPVDFLIVLARISFGFLNGKTSVALSQIRGILWNIEHLNSLLIKGEKLRNQVPMENILLTSEIYESSHLLLGFEIVFVY